PNDPWPFAFLAASYAHLGKEKDAIDAIALMNAARARAGGVPFVMVELTNLGLTAFNPPPNSPLIQGLLKLELPRDYYASEFDSVTLRGPEIATLFLGHRVHGRYLSEGLEYGVS